MNKITLKQLKWWDQHQRSAYKDGTLSKSRIKKLETIPGWYWKIDFKEEAIKECNEIFKRAKKRGYLPKFNSKNLQERKDYSWMSQKKQSRLGTNRSLWYPELEEIAKQYGFTDAFNSLKEEAIKEAHEIFKRAKEKGYLPKQNSKDEKENRDAEWIGQKKQAKSGKNLGIFYQEFEKIAEKYGFIDVFNTINFKEETLKKAHEIFKRVKERSYLPKQNSKNLQEKKDYNWISQKRKAKLGESSSIWYPELEEIAKQYNFSNIFNTRNLKEENIKECHEIFKRIKERGCLPKYNNKNSQEKKDIQWIRTKRGAKLGRLKGQAVWYQEFEEIAILYGFPDIFNTKNLKEENIKKCHEVFKRAKNRNCLPKWDSKDLQEDKDAKWISAKRRAKSGKLKGQTIWYLEFEKIAKEYGFVNVFDTIDFKKEAIKKCHEVFKRSKERGYLPKYNSLNKQERKDVKWIIHKKYAKLGKGGNVWYPELEEIVKQYGFTDAFK